MFKSPHPAITQGQIAALLTFAVGQAVAWGWISNLDAQFAVSIGATAIAFAWKLADAYLRGQRARAGITTGQPTPQGLAKP